MPHVDVCERECTYYEIASSLFCVDVSDPNRLINVPRPKLKYGKALT